MPFVTKHDSIYPSKFPPIVAQKLEAATYYVDTDQSGDFFLVKTDPLTLPSKLYGDTTALAERIVITYKSRSASTGVLLTGEKGSGKTLLSKLISHTFLEFDAPTILINKPFIGDKFAEFLQNITQEALVIFDEFEKVYSPAHQVQVLTLFDGVFSSKKLFIFTANSIDTLNINFVNRPGRIFYMIEHGGLSQSFIKE